MTLSYNYLTVGYSIVTLFSRRFSGKSAVGQHIVKLSNIVAEAEAWGVLPDSPSDAQTLSHIAWIVNIFIYATLFLVAIGPSN